MAAATVTEAAWETAVIGTDDPVIVAVCSAIGSPCRDFDPIFDAVASELEGLAQVFRMDVHDNPAVARRYEVSSLPTVLVFRRGSLAARLVGGRSQERLLEALSPFLP